MTTVRPFLLLFAALALFAAPREAAAQWTKASNAEYGIRYKMPKSLRAIPANKARPTANLVDRRDSIKPLYIGSSTYTWNIRVWAFRPKAAITGDGKAKDAGDKKRRPTAADLLRMMRGGSYTSFAEWVRKSRHTAGRQLKVEAKKSKQRGGARLRYERWEWTRGNGAWLSIAGSYRLPGREIAIVGTIPTKARKKL